jgi:hypothetical protein
MHVYIKCLDTWHHFMWVGQNFIQTPYMHIYYIYLKGSPYIYRLGTRLANQFFLIEFLISFLLFCIFFYKHFCLFWHKGDIATFNDRLVNF